MAWHLHGTHCLVEGGWAADITITVAGGTGTYEYYRDIDLLCGPTTEDRCSFELKLGGGHSVGTFHVISGETQVSEGFFVHGPDCG
jgi:hypothetical protein